MPLISGDGVGKYYGAHDVFQSISFSVGHDDRIGLVGPNGEGKTTLLRLLAGLEEPTAGTLSGKRGLRVGYLPQDPPALADVTLWDFLLEVFADLRRREAELHELAGRLEGVAGSELLARYSELQAEFDHLDGYTYERRVRTVLTGLGFSEAHWGHSLAQLSGGQRTRALLARLLLDQPELLLLDEPTNHLDLQAVEWLEGWLQTFKGSLVVVSHDRYFLDAVTGRTWEMAFKTLEAYRGNYSHYLRQREERYQQRLKQWQQQQEYIARTEEFVRKYIAGQRTKEAQGRRTRLERFLREEAIPEPRQPQHIRVRLSPNRRSGEIVLHLEDLVVGYEPGRPVLRVPDVEVIRGMRVAVVGPNGAGKTTLMRTVLGELPPLQGEARTGASVEIGYLSQTHDYLDPDAQVLDALMQVDPKMKAEQARGLLGRFLFTGDDVFRRIWELSGGQRSRVALARLAVQDANLLILDEPTNHLDIASQEILQEVLQGYDGTIVLVSHDRYLVQVLATHIWVAEEGDLQVVEGGWEEYVAWRARRAGVQAQEAVRPDRQAEREAHKEARRVRKELEKLQARQQGLEQQIQRLEEELAALSVRIGEAGQSRDMDRVHELGAAYRRLEKQLEGLWAEWEGLAEGAASAGTA
ncbi:MAG: ABC-F family ATP-binding cassette domain-containing protein [Candidatus Latescibacterota bacterium]